MSLQPGTKLGSYEIVSLIGTGGMGEVYRARDTKLGREVAVPVQTQGELVVGNVTMLCERPFTPSFFPTYSVTPDGQRFIDLEDRY